MLFDVNPPCISEVVRNHVFQNGEETFHILHDPNYREILGHVLLGYLKGRLTGYPGERNLTVLYCIVASCGGEFVSLVCGSMKMSRGC